MSSLKALLTTGLVVGMNMPLMLPAAHAQITVTLEGVTATAPNKGETQSLNVSQGARTTLAVGNGVQLGTSAQMSSSIGTISLVAINFHESSRSIFLDCCPAKLPLFA